MSAAIDRIAETTSSLKRLVLQCEELALNSLRGESLPCPPLDTLPGMIMRLYADAVASQVTDNLADEEVDVNDTEKEDITEEEDYEDDDEILLNGGFNNSSVVLSKLDSYKQAALSGDAEAFALAGKCYRDGEGTEKDLHLAVECFQLGVKKDDALSMLYLGQCYYRGHGVECNVERAADLFEQSAMLSNCEAMYSTALCYRKGDGVDKDFETEIRWLKTAAEQKYPPSMVDIAMYLKTKRIGSGVREMMRYLEMSAEVGYARALYELGVCYRDGEGVMADGAKALKYFEDAYALGFIRAANDLGLLYQSGEYWVKANPETALMWFQRGTDGGDKRCLSNLGLCHERGFGTPVDMEQAFTCYTRASEMGDSRAMNKLGDFYLNGTGCIKDDKQAVLWYSNASKNGYAVAMNRLGMCYEMGYFLEKDLSQALKWYHKAADSGFALAFLNEGRLYSEMGELGNAFECYVLGAEKKHVGCMEQTSKCYQFGDGVFKDLNKAASWLALATKYQQ